MSTDKYHTFDDGSVWPLPGDEKGGDSVEHRLRFGEHGVLTADRFHAASVLSAYRNLITMPVKRRNEVLRELRSALRT